MDVTKQQRLPILALVMVTIASTGCQKISLDRQMNALCKKDGGVKVYETVTLGPEEYEKVLGYGRTALRSPEYRFGPDYRYVSPEEVLVGKNADIDKGEGRLVRVRYALYRRSDDKLLVEQIQYLTSGGDGPFAYLGMHPSTEVCPRREKTLGQHVFVKSE